MTLFLASSLFYNILCRLSSKVRFLFFIPSLFLTSSLAYSMITSSSGISVNSLVLLKYFGSIPYSKSNESRRSASTFPRPWIFLSFWIMNFFSVIDIFGFDWMASSCSISVGIGSSDDDCDAKVDAKDWGLFFPYLILGIVGPLARISRCILALSALITSSSHCLSSCSFSSLSLYNLFSRLSSDSGVLEPRPSIFLPF